MKRTVSFSMASAWVLAFAVVLQAQAQQFGGMDNLTIQGVSYHVFARQGEATVQVLVLGSISSPGVYEVGVGTELDQLLGLTGATALASSSNTETTITVRLFREGAGRRDLVYEVPLERMLAEPGFYPPLQDGDLFTVETTTVERRKINVLNVVRTLASLSTLVILLDRLLE